MAIWERCVSEPSWQMRAYAHSTLLMRGLKRLNSRKSMLTDNYVEALIAP